MQNRFETRSVRADAAADQKWVDDRSVDGNDIYHQRWADWLQEAIDYGRKNPA